MKDGIEGLFYRRTEKMAADIFTKAIGRLNLEKHRDYLLANDTDLFNEKDTRKSLSRGFEVTTENKLKQA